MRRRIPLLAVLVVMMVQPATGEQPLVIFGASEKVGLRELGKELPARLDTGAVSMSLSAYDQESFERDGDDWVRFRLGVDNGVDTPLELPVDSTVRIRRRAEDRDDDDDEFSRRYVVRLTVCIGERSEEVRVNLTDRRDFSYPLLVGREAMEKLGIVVDPAIEKVAGDPECLDPEKEPPVTDDEELEEDEADDEEDNGNGNAEEENDNDGGGGENQEGEENGGGDD